jgi:uncharacterized membrane protein
MRRRALPAFLLCALLGAGDAHGLRAETKVAAPAQGAATASARAQLVKQLASEPWHGDDPPADPGRAAGGAAGGAAALRPEGAEPAFDPATRDRQLAAWRAYYDYRISGLRQRGAVYGWQLASSKITFAVVIFLVLVGIYFSWLQFRLSLRPRPAPVPAGAALATTVAPEAATEVARAEAVTEISAGLDGIKVSSPVLGVIILVISLLFFYLYLAYVYPINQSF